MKKTAAAILAALMLLSLPACGSRQSAGPEPAQSQSQPAQSAQASQSSQSSQSPQTVAGSVQTQTETTADPQVTYQDVFYGDSVEETASYTFTVPSFTLADAAATAKINQFYTDLANQVIDYTQKTVYQKAMSLSVVGLLDGTSDVTVKDGVITVVFKVTVTYGNDEETETHTRTDTFDAGTGECTGTVKS